MYLFNRAQTPISSADSSNKMKAKYSAPIFRAINIEYIMAVMTPAHSNESLNLLRVMKCIFKSYLFPKIYHHR